MVATTLLAGRAHQAPAGREVWAEAAATDPIVGFWKKEGTWAPNVGGKTKWVPDGGGVIEVEATATRGAFVGVIRVPIRFQPDSVGAATSDCVHRVGEQVWAIAKAGGSYQGLHGSFMPECIDVRDVPVSFRITGSGAATKLILHWVDINDLVYDSQFAQWQPPAPKKVDLSGDWTSSHGDTMMVVQHGATVRWTAISADRKSWHYEFTGTISGDSINGSFVDDPGFDRRSAGSIAGRILSECKLTIWLTEFDHRVPGDAERTTWKSACPLTERPTPTPAPPGTKPPAVKCPNGTVGVLLKSIDGDVSFRTHEGEWEDARAGQVLGLGDRISTGLDSSAVVVFANGATLTLDFETHVVIEKAPSDRAITWWQVYLEAGRIAAKYPRQLRVRSDLSIRVPVATASVRGTVFTVAYDPGTRVVTVVTTQGVVSVDPAGPQPPVQVRAGQAVTSTRTAVRPVATAFVAAQVRARSLVLARLAKAQSACKLTVRSISVTGGPRFRVTVRTSRGMAVWTVRGSHAAPANALARRIAAGC